MVKHKLQYCVQTQPTSRMVVVMVVVVQVTQGRPSPTVVLQMQG